MARFQTPSRKVACAAATSFPMKELPDSSYPRCIGPVRGHYEVISATQKYFARQHRRQSLMSLAIKAGKTQSPYPATAASIWPCRLEL